MINALVVSGLANFRGVISLVEQDALAWIGAFRWRHAGC
jgi:hypothetical protein